MSDQSPNPELLEEYGTDDVYLANLEKAASDTMFGAPMASVSQAEWGRLIVAHAAHQQAKVDRQRAQAAALNLQFRRLEAQRMANTIENFGGAGTRRSAYIRAMQTQPHMVHPMLLAGGYGGMGGGLMGPEAMGAMGNPMGAGVHRETPMAHPEGFLPQGQADAEMDALEGELEHVASADVEIADRMGRDMAHRFWELQKEAQQVPGGGDTAEEVGAHYGRSAGQMANAVRAMGGAAGEAAVGTGKALVGGAGAIGGALKSVGRGFRDWMAADVQPTPNWGMGYTPASDVNQYGQPIY